MISTIRLTFHRTAMLALALGISLTLAQPAEANTTFNVKKMTRTDVPRGEGQCDIRIRVDDEIEFALSGNRVETRTLSGQNPTDAGSECNFPFPKGRVANMRWEVRDGRGRAELIDEPSRNNGMRAVFNVRDPQGGASRYHVRVKWDLSGSSDTGATSGGTWGSGAAGTGNRPGRPGRPSSGAGSGWGSGGNGSGGSGWGTGTGWGSTPPPASLSNDGRGPLTWSGRQARPPIGAAVRGNGDRATIRINTTANRTIEFQGVVRSSSSGFFEVDLDGSSEGAVVGMARVDYSNNTRLDRVDINGNAGRDRIRVDFKR